MVRIMSSLGGGLFKFLSKQNLFYLLNKIKIPNYNVKQKVYEIN